MKHTLKILSLFDGISCAQQALKELAEKNPKYRVTHYYSSEIGARPIEITQRNFPGTQQIGDITKVEGKNFKGVDLLIGGSPCQDLSIANKDRKGLGGERSKLFFEYIRILKEAKPKYFLLENVASMSKENREIINKVVGCEPIMIDAALVSAQTRKRLFWTNIPGIKQPKDLGILLKHIILKKVDEKYFISEETALKARILISDGNGKARSLTAKMWKGARSNGMTCIRIGSIGKGSQGDRIYSIDGKSVTLSATTGGKGGRTGLYQIKQRVRKLTPVEAERLQCLPDGYTEGTSDTQRYEALGNAFNVGVIKHILSHI